MVLGNPPWERIKLQEQEFFARSRPDIADAPNAAARRRMIDRLAEEDPPLHAAFLAARRRAEGESHLVRNSGRYPLCGRGDVNTYAVFAETKRALVGPTGRVGTIVPSGIATDDTTKFFFQNLMDGRALVSLYDFENRAKLFPAVDSRMKFCLLTLTGAAAPATRGAEFAFFCHRTDDLRDPERRFTLSAEDIALLNPNTRTCPVFRSRRDAELTKAVYRRGPVLVREGPPEENPWGVSFTTMFHMSNDSHLFRTRQELESQGWRLEGNVFVRGASATAGDRAAPTAGAGTGSTAGVGPQTPDRGRASAGGPAAGNDRAAAAGNDRAVARDDGEEVRAGREAAWDGRGAALGDGGGMRGADRAADRGDGEPQGERAPAGGSGGRRGERYLPLYEAKMIHHFDHRWATYDGLDTRDLTPAEKADPGAVALPRYWVPEAEVEARLRGRWGREWLLGWRDITNSTNERTVIASVVPRVGVGHTCPLMTPNSASAPLAACLLANLSSLAFDFVTRQKIGGTHLTYGYLDQLPILPPEAYVQPALWSPDETVADWMLPRVLELVYTSGELQPFARDCGYDGPPFAWDEERRFQLRCELDAAFFHLYGIEREDVDYIMETFPIVKRKDEARSGEYRTKRVVLELYDELGRMTGG
ncbi:MAG: hypothetical protein Kow00122_18590 [Thermoleophilia bacterium]